eukprot:COSAG02_NODE_41276_length_396_cov_0.831650_1_plen_29_part_10
MTLVDDAIRLLRCTPSLLSYRLATNALTR